MIDRQLADAFRRRDQLHGEGLSTQSVDEEIRDLQRRRREGGNIREGDFLADGRYVLKERIGTGGFGTVWKAKRRGTEEFVAIKILHPQHALDEDRRGRFFRGAHAMADLRHPNIVRVLQAEGEDGGYHYFVMELVDGMDLRAAVGERRLTPKAALTVVAQIAEALAHAHARGFVHRDVKPANILLRKTGEPLLTDFDLVRTLHAFSDTKSEPLGTYTYAAPEVLSHPRSSDARADVYSLGMTAIYLLRGEEPKKGGVHRTIEDLACSRELKQALTRAVAEEAADRFSTIEELRSLILAELARLEPARVEPARVEKGAAPARGLPEKLRVAVRASGGDLFVDFPMLRPISSLHKPSATTAAWAGIYEVSEPNPLKNRLIKLFGGKMSPSHQERVLELIRLKVCAQRSPRQEYLFAAPMHLVFDGEHPVGYVMPDARGIEWSQSKASKDSPDTWLLRALALAAACRRLWGLRVLHGDLSTKNIILDPGGHAGTVAIIDFDEAWALPGSSTPVKGLEANRPARFGMDTLCPGTVMAAHDAAPERWECAAALVAICQLSAQDPRERIAWDRLASGVETYMRDVPLKARGTLTKILKSLVAGKFPPMPAAPDTLAEADQWMKTATRAIHLALLTLPAQAAPAGARRAEAPSNAGATPAPPPARPVETPRILDPAPAAPAATPRPPPAEETKGAPADPRAPRQGPAIEPEDRPGAPGTPTPQPAFFPVNFPRSTSTSHCEPAREERRPPPVGSGTTALFVDVTPPPANATGTPPATRETPRTGDVIGRGQAAKDSISEAIDEILASLATHELAAKPAPVPARAESTGLAAVAPSEAAAKPAPAMATATEPTPPPARSASSMGGDPKASPLPLRERLARSKTAASAAKPAPARAATTAVAEPAPKPPPLPQRPAPVTPARAPEPRPARRETVVIPAPIAPAQKQGGRDSEETPTDRRPRLDSIAPMSVSRRWGISKRRLLVSILAATLVGFTLVYILVR